MSRPFATFGVALLLAVLPFSLAAPVAAYEFPPITDAGKNLGEYPGASAVILFEDAHFHFRDFVTEASSRIEVTTRVKILEEEGKSEGEVLILHDRQLRLDRVEGRTIQPDGTVIELTESDVFLDRISRADRRFVTKVVFPQVEVGSILDYHYVFYWDTIYYLEPWLFHGRLPKVRSQIRYYKPDRLGVKFWMRETTADKIDIQQEKTVDGHEIVGTMTHLPPMPDEPYSFPLEDIASRMLLYPNRVNFSGRSIPLMEDWRDVFESFEEAYTDFRRKDRKAKKEAKRLVDGAATREEKIDILYRHVRDQVRTDSSDAVWIGGGSEADQVLEDGQGSDAEKALLLQTLLQAVGIEADALWADSRLNGRAELSLPNPAFLDRVLVAVPLGEEWRILDPSDETLASGRIQPYFQGTNAITVDEKDPQIIPIPASEARDNLRRVEVSLALDEEGRASGTGSLELHGHAAWQRLGVDDDPTAAWTERLEGAHPSFEVSAVEVKEDIESTRLHVGFTLRQRDEAVLGDETSLGPAGYLALQQPFPHTPAERITPVMMLYPRRDEVRWTLTYPEGWTLDVLPISTEIANDEGSFRADYQADPEARTVRLERHFERSHQDIPGKDRYQRLRLLYRVASESDARNVSLYLP